MGTTLLLKVSKKLADMAARTSLDGAQKLFPSSVTSCVSQLFKRKAQAHQIGSDTLIHRLTHLSTEKKQKLFQILFACYIVAKVSGIPITPAELLSNPMQLFQTIGSVLNVSSETISFLWNLLPEGTLKTMGTLLSNCNIGGVLSFTFSSAFSIGKAVLPAAFDVYVMSTLGYMIFGSPNAFFSKLIDESQKECAEENKQSTALEEVKAAAGVAGTTDDYFKERVKINPSALKKVPQALLENADFLTSLLDDPKKGEEAKKNEKKEQLVDEIIKNEKLMQKAGVTDDEKKDFLIALAKKYPPSINKIISLVPDALKGSIDLLTQLIEIAPKEQRLSISKEALKFLLIPRGTSADDMRDALQKLMTTDPMIIPYIVKDNTCKALMLSALPGGGNTPQKEFIKEILTSASQIPEALKEDKIAIAQHLFAIILPTLTSLSTQEATDFLTELSKIYHQMAVPIMANDTKLPHPVKEELNQSTDFLVVLAKYHVDTAIKLGDGKGLAYQEEFSAAILRQRAPYFKQLPEDLSKDLPFLSKALVYNHALMKEILGALDNKEERRSTFLTLVGLTQKEYNQLPEDEKKRVPSPALLFKSEFMEMMGLKKEEEKTNFLIDAAVVVPDILKVAGKAPLKDVKMAKKILLRNPEAFVYLDIKLKTDSGFLNQLLSYELESVQKQILEQIANDKDSSLKIPELQKDKWMIWGIASKPSLMEEWEKNASLVATKARERIVAIAKRPLFKDEYKSILVDLPAEAWTTALIREAVRAKPAAIHNLLMTETSLLAYGLVQQRAQAAHPNNPGLIDLYIKEELEAIATHRYTDYLVDHPDVADPEEKLKAEFIKKEKERYNLFVRYINLLIKETDITMKVAPAFPSIVLSNKEIRQSRVLIEKLCKENPKVLQFASDDIKNDVAFLNKLARKYGMGIYQHAKPHGRDPRNPLRQAYDFLKKKVIG